MQSRFSIQESCINSYQFFPQKINKYQNRSTVISLDLQGGEPFELDPIKNPLQSLTNNKTEAIGSASTIKSVRALDLQEGESIELDNCAAKRQRTKGKSFLSEGHCEGHDICAEMRCMDCEVWICSMCVELLHNHCRTLVVEEAYIELKKQLSQKVETELGKRKETFVRLDKSLRILDDERKFLIEEIKKKEQKLKDCEKRVRELESINYDGRKFSQKLLQLHGLVESSTISSELSKAMNELEKVLEEQKTEIPDDIGLGLSFFRVPLSKKQLENWCLTGSVFAEKNSIDGTKYGKVSVKDGQILIHHFQPEKPVGCIIPFKEILSKFDGSPPEFPHTGFLRLTPILGETKGFDVLIKTDGTSPRAKNFLLLCSALKGPTYKGSRMNPVKFVPESTFYQMTRGPAPVVEGIKNIPPFMPIKKGGVYGSRSATACFFISWMDCPSQSFSEFGTVIAGLQGLSEPKGCLSVSDCGLVI